MTRHDTGLQTLLREGFGAWQAGDDARAARACAAVLEQHPEQADALHLSGMLARRAGHLDAAEQLWQRSLQARPAQPQVFNSLGNLHAQQGQDRQALASFDRALALQPQHADAHYNRARVLQRMGRGAEAANALAIAIAAAPVPTAAMLQLQAAIEADADRLQDALATLAAALRLAPDKPALLHNRATILQRLHRHEEALQAHERAFSLGLDHADAHYNHGNTLQSLGHHALAATAYRRALIRQPGHRLALYDLARLRWRMGEPDFDTELLHASIADLSSATAPGIRAHLLWRAERHAEAAAAYAQAMERDPARAQFHDGFGRCLVRLGRIQEGLAAHQRAVDLAPEDAELRVNQAASLLAAGSAHWTDAETVASAAHAFAPHDQHALALLALAWRLQGHARATWLADVERFIGVFDLPAPSGSDDLRSFNRELAGLLQTWQHDRQAPVDQTVRVGTQTNGNLFSRHGEVLHPLLDRFGAAIDAFIAALPDDPTHPFLCRKAAGWRYSDAWSTRLDSGGFHTNHVHPHGWISAVYYVAVPPDCQDTQRHAGWLQFGQPDFDTGATNPVMRRVKPEPGRLVLFPSMFWHGTAAFEDAAPRVTIAFDILPA